MLRLNILAIALMGSAIPGGAETLVCSQGSNLSTARLRWAAVRKNHADPAHHEENCRSYAANFFEAVTVRQAASFCKDDIDRERILELLDSEIEALNNVIATSLQRVMTCRRSIWVGVKISAPTARDERHLQL